MEPEFYASERDRIILSGLCPSRHKTKITGIDADDLEVGTESDSAGVWYPQEKIQPLEKIWTQA